MEKTKNYLKGCLETNEEIVALGYHKNENFVAEVVARYEDNLRNVNEEYSEVNAKDDAIELVFDFWKKMNATYK